MTATRFLRCRPSHSLDSSWCGRSKSHLFSNRRSFPLVRGAKGYGQGGQNPQIPHVNQQQEPAEECCSQSKCVVNLIPSWFFSAESGFCSSEYNFYKFQELWDKGRRAQTHPVDMSADFVLFTGRLQTKGYQTLDTGGSCSLRGSFKHYLTLTHHWSRS